MIADVPPRTSYPVAAIGSGHSAGARWVSVEGGARLSGEIQTSGAKNAATKMMASALLTSEPVVLENVPSIDAIRTQSALLTALGASVEWDAVRHTVTIVAEHLNGDRLIESLA